jgi:ribosomal protein L11 methyltransferase
MLTYSAIAKIADPEAADRLALACEGLEPEPTGVGTFEIEDGSGLWEVAAYFVEKPDLAALALLAKVHGAQDFIVSEVPDQDWVAKVRRDLAPVEAGRFFVYGSHDADKLPLGRIGLLIEAAMAFGTGHHGTTLGCLRALDHLIDDGFVARRAADIGCGTAVLAMATAKVFPDPVIASDIDPIAVEVAETNIRTNGLSGRVICLEATGFDQPEILAAAPFDLVFANILKGPLIALAPDMAGHLAPGGFAILSGILNEQAADVIEVYARNGFNLVEHQKIVDWSTLTLQRM